MSEMRNYCALRVKIKEEYQDYSKLFTVLSELIGKPDEIEYKSEWNGLGYDTTNEIEYFNYNKGDYRVVSSDDCLFIDKVLFDKSLDYDLDLCVAWNSWDNLVKEMSDKFSDIMTSDVCRLIVTSWYTGCDMPIRF